MDCKECHKKMPFIGRIESTRFFFCQHCERITLIVDGCARRDYHLDGE